MLKRLFAKPVTWVAVLVLGAGAAVGLYWFQPWRLFTDTTVNETLSTVGDVPTSVDASTGAGAPTSAGVPSSAAPSPTEPAGPVVVRTGSFITHEHATAGTARLVRNPDGSHQVELVGLETSDGPDLRVWLTDQAVREGTAGWRVFDDGKWTELGRLKGNRGDQVYPVPGKVDPEDYRSISIWCKRF
ncbi:DM13 domain-containing protein, partial [Actinoplanes sp. NPDC048791]|uniref:DM13 domain-containing protein n=1 Tax=Actinoplanes sp. NPDC048791 TaxID=3154623 RepID=UPI0033D780A3